MKLEEKRNRSSFYLNLWYNAKAFLSAKIYGVYGEEGMENININLEENDLRNLDINDLVNKGKNKAINDESKNSLNKNQNEENDFDQNENELNQNNFNGFNNEEIMDIENTNNKINNNSNKKDLGKIEYDDDDEIDVQF